MNTTTVQRIARLTRLKNSVNGNARYRVDYHGGGCADTAADAAIGGVIGNSEYRDVPVKFTLDGRGRIILAEPVGDAR
jgi:hypothetical protein